MYVRNLKVGETKRVRARAADAGENVPAFLQPGSGGSPGTQWSPVTGGIVTALPIIPGEGEFCDFTGLAVGSTLVDVHGINELGAPVSSQMQVNVTVGPATHYNFEDA